MLRDGGLLHLLFQPRFPHVLTCGHGGCATCIAAWFKENTTCPTCRDKTKYIAPVRMAWSEQIPTEEDKEAIL